MSEKEPCKPKAKGCTVPSLRVGNPVLYLAPYVFQGHVSVYILLSLFPDLQIKWDMKLDLFQSLIISLFVI